MPFASIIALAVQPFVQGDALPRRGVLGLGFSPLPAEKAAELKLPAGIGAIAAQPVAGLTAAMAGFKPGDILIAINGKPVAISAIASTIRELPSGKEASFEVLRDGTKQILKATLQPKRLDPGNANYEVIYSHVVSNGQRMRTIITKPRKPGKYPAFMFIQGFSPISYDYVLETSTGDVTTLDGPLLYDFANGGFVTIRVEKPGVGDSEGGPFAEMDYTTELDIYRQTINQLKARDDVDTNNVFIFGHSMGGAFGPMIACETKVKGLAVYGVAARTWFEYLLDTIRYQGLVGGQSYEAADEEVRQGSRLMALVFHEGMSPEEVKLKFPDMAQLVDGYFPGGKFNAKAPIFWRQLGQINFASYWAKCGSHVLAVRGISDFVTYDADHKLIADIVNRANPGFGKFAIAPSSDHLFHDFATEPDSLRNFQRGKYNPAFSKMMMEWMREVIAKSKPGN